MLERKAFIQPRPQILLASLVNHKEKTVQENPFMQTELEP